MTKNFILIGLMLTWVVLPLNVFSQTVLKMNHYTACRDTTLIPIEIEHFEDIAAFSLFIKVDAENVEYVDVQDINEVFTTGDFVGGINLQTQTIVLNWFSLTAANLDTGMMCNIRVLFKNDTANFDFQDNCEIVHSDLSIVEDVEYFNGALIAFSSSLVPDPVSQTLLEGNPATIELLGIIEGISSQWQKKENEIWTDLGDILPYFGAQTAQLSIQPVSLDLNGSLFRCLLSNNICSEASDESELLVLVDAVEELDDRSRMTPINIYPNPVDDYLNCIFNTEVLSAELRLIDMEGVMLIHKQLGNIVSGKTISLALDGLRSGTYILQLFDYGQLIASKRVLRK